MCEFLGAFLNIEIFFRKMLNTFYHISFDDYEIEKLNNNIRFGYRRLSFLDLTPNEHRPTADFSKGYGIVFNGYIFNFRN